MKTRSGNAYLLDANIAWIVTRLNIASKLFSENKPAEAQTKPQEPLRPSPPKPSGFYVCSRHAELPPMSITEFDNHKTRHDMSNHAQKSSNVQSWGLIGLWKNTSIKTCEAISIPEGDGRLRLVPTIPGTQGYTIVKEVIREVLVTCRHCGARYPQGTPKCFTCGANL